MSVNILAKFLISGGVNTALTYAVYLALLQGFPYPISYTFAFFFGIALMYALNRYFVFEAHRGVLSVVVLPLIYLVQYLLGLFLIWIFVEILGLTDSVAPLLVSITSVPLTYKLSRSAFLSKFM